MTRGQGPWGWPRPGFAHQLLPETGHPSPSAAIHLDHLPDTHIDYAAHTHRYRWNGIHFLLLLYRVLMLSIRQHTFLWNSLSLRQDIEGVFVVTFSVNLWLISESSFLLNALLAVNSVCWQPRFFPHASNELHQEVIRHGGSCYAAARWCFCSVFWMGSSSSRAQLAIYLLIKTK